VGLDNLVKQRQTHLVDADMQQEANRGETLILGDLRAKLLVDQTWQPSTVQDAHLLKKWLC